MNPDQLWETTLDPEALAMLRVYHRCTLFAGGSNCSTTLMGDESRTGGVRNFIQEKRLERSELRHIKPEYKMSFQKKTV